MFLCAFRLRMLTLLGVTGTMLLLTLNPVEASAKTEIDDMEAVRTSVNDCEAVVEQLYILLTTLSTSSTVPVTDPTTEPVSTDPITEPVSPSTKPVSTDPITEPVSSSTKPVSTDPITEPVSPSTKPVSTDPITEPVSPSTKPVSTDPITKPVSTVSSTESTPVVQLTTISTTSTEKSVTTDLSTEPVSSSTTSTSTDSITKTSSPESSLSSTTSTSTIISTSTASTSTSKTETPESTSTVPSTTTSGSPSTTTKQLSQSTTEDTETTIWVTSDIPALRATQPANKEQSTEFYPFRTIPPLRATQPAKIHPTLATWGVLVDNTLSEIDSISTNISSAPSNTMNAASLDTQTKYLNLLVKFGNNHPMVVMYSDVDGLIQHSNETKEALQTIDVTLTNSIDDAKKDRTVNIVLITLGTLLAFAIIVAIVICFVKPNEKSGQRAESEMSIVQQDRLEGQKGPGSDDLYKSFEDRFGLPRAKLSRTQNPSLGQAGPSGRSASQSASTSREKNQDERLSKY